MVRIRLDGDLPVWALIVLVLLAVIANVIYWIGLADALGVALVSGGLLRLGLLIATL